MGCGPTAQATEVINSSPYIITLLGLPNVGKTSFIEYLTGEYSRDNPPVHTNGLLIREIVVQGVKYRFNDLSGYYSHLPEWEDSLNISDAAIFFCDKSGAKEGIYFTTEILQRIGPLICEKPQKKTKKGKEKKAKNIKFDKEIVGQYDIKYDPNIQEVKEFKENPIPVFILVTKSEPDLDLTDLKKEVNKYLPNVQKEYGIVSDFDQNVYKTFDWLQNILLERKKK